MAGSKREEINLLELTSTLWSSKKFIATVATGFAFLGIIIAMIAPVEFKASSKLLLEKNETEKSGLGGLSGLAGLAGISLDPNASESITPAMYPAIVESVPFQLNLLHREIPFSNLDKSTSSYVYFKELRPFTVFEFLKRYTLNLPGTMRGLLSQIVNKEIDVTSQALDDSEGPIYLSYADTKLIEDFRKRFSVEIDEATGLIMVSTEMPDPTAAAFLAEALVKQLTDKIIAFKIEKVQNNLSFIEERYEVVKKEYYAQQKQLALFNDQNRNLNRSLLEIENQRLQQELDITFEVYKGLASQLEQAKIKVKEEMPVFSILEPVRIPVSKSQPKRALIVVSAFFFGLMLAIIFVTGRSILNSDLLEA